MIKPLQYFSDDYLQHCKKMTPEQILRFLEEFRLMQMPEPKSRLISLKVPQPMLALFKQKCAMTGVKYQTQIKSLMQRWLQD